MVNLVRGRRSFFCNLGQEASFVKFDCNGDKFFMGMEDKISVHEAEDAKLILELESKKRNLCIAPAMNGLVYAGGEDRNLTAWDTVSGKVASCIEDAHTARLKGIVVLSKIDGTSDDEPFLVASASSDGIIRVWDVRMVNKDKSVP